MKCKLCGQTCFAKAELSSSGYKSVSSCCNAEIDLTDDYSKDQFQSNWHNYPTTGSVTGYPKSEITLRDAIAIEAMKIMLHNELTVLRPVLKEHDPVDEKKYIAEYCYSLADEFEKAKNK